MVLVRASELKREKLEEISEMIDKRIDTGESGDLQTFVALLYGRVAPEDILGLTTENLYGAALSCWKFLSQRSGGEPNVRVFNPKVEEHGWKSSHTVIEIINDDMPFLYDSVSGALNFKGHHVHLALHPVIAFERDENGLRTALTGGVVDKSWGAGERLESFMHLEINEQSDAATLAEIEQLVRDVLADVYLAVTDWPAMQQRADDTVQELKSGKLPVEAAEVGEVVDFLEWMRDDHFPFSACAITIMSAATARMTWKSSRTAASVSCAIRAGVCWPVQTINRTPSRRSCGSFRSARSLP